MDSKNLVGVVTVTYNSDGVLGDFLRCLFAQSHVNFLLYAVDNASSDRTRELLEGCIDPRLKVIANNGNLGVAEGNNQGIRAAINDGCEFVLLINNDTEFDERLIASMLEGLAEHRAEMVCPKMMYFDEPHRIWAAGGEFWPWLGYHAKHLGFNKPDSSKFDQVRKVTYAPTCCVLIRKELFASIGLMDARYFVYADDTDFMYRAMKAKAKLIYWPSVIIYHKVGSLTGPDQSPFTIRFGTRNRLFFLMKHFGLIRTMPWLAICQFYWIARVLSGRKDVKWIRIKERAFWESITMFLRG